jgi:hypothetical protein
LSLGSGSGKGISREWNECPVRGCGAWWPYKSERVGLGWFGLVGYREGSGWGREADMGTKEEVKPNFRTPPR